MYITKRITTYFIFNLCKAIDYFSLSSQVDDQTYFDASLA